MLSLASRGRKSSTRTVAGPRSGSMTGCTSFRVTPRSWTAARGPRWTSGPARAGSPWRWPSAACRPSASTSRPSAVQLARSSGALALHRDVFATVPGTGRWARVLLADGNIGIGGDPDALLSRVAELLKPLGQALVEVEPPGAPLAKDMVRLSHAGQCSSWFPVGVHWRRPDQRARPARRAGRDRGMDGCRPLVRRACPGGSTHDRETHAHRGPGRRGGDRGRGPHHPGPPHGPPGPGDRGDRHHSRWRSACGPSSRWAPGWCCGCRSAGRWP